MKFDGRWRQCGIISTAESERRNAMALIEEIQNGKNAALEFKEACTSRDAEIGCVLSEIMEKLKGSVSRENEG